MDVFHDSYLCVHNNGFKISKSIGMEYTYAGQRTAVLFRMRDDTWNVTKSSTRSITCQMYPIPNQVSVCDRSRDR